VQDHFMTPDPRVMPTSCWPGDDLLGGRNERAHAVGGRRATTRSFMKQGDPADV